MTGSPDGTNRAAADAEEEEDPGLRLTIPPYRDEHHDARAFLWRDGRARSRPGAAAADSSRLRSAAAPRTAAEASPPDDGGTPARRSPPQRADRHLPPARRRQAGDARRQRHRAVVSRDARRAAGPRPWSAR